MKVKLHDDSQLGLLLKETRKYIEKGTESFRVNYPSYYAQILDTYIDRDPKTGWAMDYPEKAKGFVAVCIVARFNKDTIQTVTRWVKRTSE